MDERDSNSWKNNSQLGKNLFAGLQNFNSDFFIEELRLIAIFFTK